MASAFQANAFQNSAFQTEAAVVVTPSLLDITSTLILHKPIDYALAGEQNFPIETGREYDIRPRNLPTHTRALRSSVQAISGGKPSFTTATNNRGYD